MNKENAVAVSVVFQDSKAGLEFESLLKSLSEPNENGKAGNLRGDFHRILDKMCDIVVVAREARYAPHIAHQAQSGLAPPRLHAHPFEGLTCRETEILQHLSFGRNAKRIARYLNISYQTVRTHQKNIYRKLDVSSVTAAVNCYRNAIM